MQAGWVRGAVLLCAVYCCDAAAAGEPKIRQGFDANLRAPFRLTDRADMGPGPKAYGESAGRELYLAYRASSRRFEVRFNGRAAEIRTVQGRRRDVNLVQGTIEAGPHWGPTSLLAVWEATYVQDDLTKRRKMHQNDIGFRLKHVLHFFGSDAWTPVSLRVSYARVRPDGFSRMRAVADAEWNFRMTPKASVLLVPELGWAHYDDFFGHDRSDVIASIRATPRYDLGSGFSAAVSVFGAVVASSHSKKSGGEFEVRPELRWRM